MAEAIAAQGGGLRTADGRPLGEALAAAQSRARRRAFLLVAPLLFFVLFSFVVPIGQLLVSAFRDDDFARNAPALAAWFDANPRGTPIDESAYAALAADLKAAKENRTAGQMGERINYEVSGARSLFTTTARSADKFEPPYREAILAVKTEWDDPRLWESMRQASSSITPNFFLASLDLRRSDTGGIERAPEEVRVYQMLYLRTFLLSALITFTCLVLGYPIAHLLATLPLRYSNLLMILVLLPFWTSLLVRTTAWIVLLQGEGVLNNILVGLGVIGDDGRIRMIYNQAGTIIAMTHILLPFMVLPLYSVMRPIPPSYVRAARSLGATSWTAFRRIYVPQTMPGVAAGGLLVFILAVGYYITPALVGGASGQLISNLIAFHFENSNWSMAAALASLLLMSVLLLYWLYDRLIGIDNLKLG
jgi:putative spermidine/putrescine transport system permease protein